MNQKERNLVKIEKELNSEYNLAQRLSESTKEDTEKAINNLEVVYMRVAGELINTTSDKLNAAWKHRERHQDGNFGV